MGNVALYNYVNKLHIEILYLWVNIVILLDSNNEIKKIGVTAPLNPKQYSLKIRESLTNIVICLT